jgi:hypothetical protein
MPHVIGWRVSSVSHSHEIPLLAPAISLTQRSLQKAWLVEYKRNKFFLQILWEFVISATQGSAAASDAIAGAADGRLWHGE